MLTSSGSSDGSDYSFFDDWMFDGVSINTDIQQPQCHPPCRKWLILLLYCLVTFTSSCTYLTLFGIPEVLCEFYSLQEHQLNWISKIFLVVQIIAMLPGAFYLFRNGLRQTIVVGCGVSLISTSLFLAAAQRKGQIYLFLGVLINGLAGSLLQPAAPMLAFIWFPDKYFVLVTNLAITIGQILGLFVSFLIRNKLFEIPTLNQEDEDMTVIEKWLQLVVGGQAGVGLCIFIMVLSFFKDKEKHDVASNWHEGVDTESISLLDFVRRLKPLLRNVNFHLIAHSMALTVAALYCAVTIFGNFSSLPGNKQLMRWINFSGISSQLPGVVMISIVADRWKRYKLIACCISASTVGCWICFTQSLLHTNQVIIVIFVFSLTNFFNTSYGGIVIKIIHDFSHTLPPSTPYAIIMVLTNSYYSIAVLFSWLIKNDYTSQALWLVTGMFLLSFLLIILTRSHQASSLDHTDEMSESNSNFG